MRKLISQDEERYGLSAVTSVLGAQWPSDWKFRNVLHGSWAEFDYVINQCRGVVDHLTSWVCVLDALDEVVDESFRNACFLSGMLLTEYLWIDAICINQDNDEEIAFEVRHVIDIYQHAVATIYPHSQLEEQFQCGQVRWSRYELLCGETSTSEQLWLLKARLTETDSLESLASTITPEVFFNIKSYAQGNVDVLSDSEPLLVFHAPKSLTSLKARPRLDQPPTSSKDASLARNWNPSLSEAQSEDINRVPYVITTAWSRIDEAIEHLGQKNMLHAITKLVQARELTTISIVSSKSALQVHLQASIYLALTFLIDGGADAAMELLDNLKVPAEEGHGQESNFATM
jgi:hypothetical protein